MEAEPKLLEDWMWYAGVLPPFGDCLFESKQDLLGDPGIPPVIVFRRMTLVQMAKHEITGKARMTPIRWGLVVHDDKNLTLGKVGVKEGQGVIGSANPDLVSEAIQLWEPKLTTIHMGGSK